MLVVVTSTFIFIGLDENSWEAGPGWTAFNDKTFITMWGLSFYMYEGVGSLIPVLEASDYKENFSVLLTTALVTLCSIHIYFSELCYYYWGDNLKEPLVTEQFPQDNWYLLVAKLLFCINILFSIPLMIYITNNIVERYVFSKMRFSTLRTWLKNLSRTIVLSASALIAFFLYYQIHKVFSLVGVVVGTFVVIITPNLIHYREMGDSQCTRIGDIFYIVYAIIAAIVIGTLIIYDWNGALSH